MRDEHVQEASSIAKLLLKKRREDLSEEELKRCMQWRQQSEENARLYAELMAAVDPLLLLEGLRDYPAEPALEKVLRQVDQQVKVRRFPWFYLKVAAAVGLLVGAGLWYYQRQLEGSDLSQAYAYQTQKGQTSQFHLPDSTKVWLNAGSSLTFVQDKKQHRRRAILSGEAYFDVKHDVKNPFHLQVLDSIEVRVLGTRFNARAYPAEKLARISLREGSLQVAQAGSQTARTSLHLKPGQGALWDPKADSLTKVAIDTATIADWRLQVIRFENERFDAVIAELERHYNVDIELNKQALAAKEVSMQLQNSSLKEVLDVLGFSLGFQYRFTDQHSVLID